MTNALGGSVGRGVPRPVNVKLQKHAKITKLPANQSGMASQEISPVSMRGPLRRRAKGT